MALEMKVYGEIRAYEAKVIGPLSWRQLLCVTIAAPLVAIVSWLLWFRAQDFLTYIDFLIFLPFAAWGWWRPKGLKPETYLPYLRDRYFSRKVLTYAVSRVDAPARQGIRGRRGDRAERRIVQALEVGEPVASVDTARSRRTAAPSQARTHRPGDAPLSGDAPGRSRLAGC